LQYYPEETAGAISRDAEVKGREEGFCRANSQAGFCLHPDRSQARVGRVPGRPAGPVRVLKHWIEGHYAMFLNSKLNNFTSTLQKSNNTQWLAEKMCFFHCILKVFLKKFKFLF
jgi:hypothetical protein